MRNLVLSAVLPVFAFAAQANDVAPEDLSQYLWTKRPILVFADSERDPRFINQMEYLAEEPDAIEDRDVVVITDTEPNSALREKYRPKGFTLILIGKDGTIKLRKPHPWTVREIGRVIDKMPMRQQEMERR